MYLSLEQFCQVVGRLQISNAEKALSMLWYIDHSQHGVTKTAGQLTKILNDYHLGTPNQTALAEAIRKTKLATELKSGFMLKPGSRNLIRSWLPELVGIQPKIDHGSGFVPEPIWRGTRGYVEEVCREINGCCHNGYFNSAAVMLRRLVETLIIEAYEHLKREGEIKDISGNYFMLSDLAERACGESGHAGLGLGRDSKLTLKEIRRIGNWSAHARRFLAHSNDIYKFQAGLRMLIQDLIQVAHLQKSNDLVIK